MRFRQLVLNAFLALGFAVQPALGQVCSESFGCGARQDVVGLINCLEGEQGFGDDSKKLLGYQRKIPKVTYPGSGDGYELARNSNYANRFPAAVVWAESADDVVRAVNCAVSSGYRVSPRGRGHSYQGLSSMDGYVVIDMTETCKPEEFVVDKTVTGDYILPGQKYIGTIKAGAGCTNAVMLHTAHTNFEVAEGAIYGIGSCPSVGVIGYTLGGGSGDATPYTGWGVDPIVGFEIVLYNGTIAAVSKDENPDLYWALRGGGGGLGVITSLTARVIQAPDPSVGTNERKYTQVDVKYGLANDTMREKLLTAIQGFFYDTDPQINSRFGGNGGFSKNAANLHGIFLGSADDFLQVFGDAGLLDEDILLDGNPFLMRDYEIICNATGPCDASGVPSTKEVRMAEFLSYGEMMGYKLCSEGQPTGSPVFFNITMSQTTGNVCADLNISETLCSPGDLHVFGGTAQFPDCTKAEVLSALLDKAGDPLSFVNTRGPSREVLDTANLTYPFYEPSSEGGLLIPKVDIDTLMDITAMALPVTHLQHGTPMMAAGDEAALPWRDTAIMTEFRLGSEQKRNTFAAMARFYGNDTAFQGYYNYMNPVGDPNWRHYYFGDSYERLSQIKYDNDPRNVFGNPLNVEPANPVVSATDPSPVLPTPSDPSPSQTPSNLPPSPTSQSPTLEPSQSPMTSASVNHSIPAVLCFAYCLMGSLAWAFIW